MLPKSLEQCLPHNEHSHICGLSDLLNAQLTVIIGWFHCETSRITKFTKYRLKFATWIHAFFPSFSASWAPLHPPWLQALWGINRVRGREEPVRRWKYCRAGVVGGGRRCTGWQGTPARGGKCDLCPQGLLLSKWNLWFVLWGELAHSVIRKIKRKKWSDGTVFPLEISLTWGLEGKRCK